VSSMRALGVLAELGMDVLRRMARVVRALADGGTACPPASVRTPLSLSSVRLVF
jgi:hypothetical protein